MAFALGAPSPTTAPPPPRLFLLLAFPSLARRSLPLENTGVRVFKLGWSGGLPNLTAHPPPHSFVARAPSSPPSSLPRHYFHQSPPSLVRGRCCRTNLLGQGKEEGLGESAGVGGAADADGVDG
ncbi:hypothetical protein VPH35_129379 [Triticum aestivum]